MIWIVLYFLIGIGWAFFAMPRMWVWGYIPGMGWFLFWTVITILLWPIHMLTAWFGGRWWE